MIIRWFQVLLNGFDLGFQLLYFLEGAESDWGGQTLHFYSNFSFLSFLSWSIAEVFLRLFPPCSSSGDMLLTLLSQGRMERLSGNFYLMSEAVEGLKLPLLWIVLGDMRFLFRANCSSITWCNHVALVTVMLRIISLLVWDKVKTLPFLLYFFFFLLLKASALQKYFFLSLFL